MSQTVPIPVEFLRKLSTDGGITGITNMLKEKGWDGQKPIMTQVHKLDALGSIVESKWVVQGKAARVKIGASNVWTTVTDKELFFSLSMDDLEQYRFLYLSDPYRSDQHRHSKMIATTLSVTMDRQWW